MVFTKIYKSYQSFTVNMGYRKNLQKKKAKKERVLKNSKKSERVKNFELNLYDK